MTRANPLTSHELHSFEDCRDAFFGADNASAKWREGFGIRDLVIGPNRYLRPITWRTQAGIPTAYAIVLYDTEVVRYYDDGCFSVDNGGFATPTTMYTVNAVLPPRWSVYHERKQLKLVCSGGGGVIHPATHARRVDANPDRT